MAQLTFSRTMGEQSAVSLDRVSKTYRSVRETPVLADFSLRVDVGAFVAVSGPVGSGKSTLLNVIGGIIRSDRGEVTVLGSSLGRMKEGEMARWRLGRVGMMSQVQDLLPDLSVEENVGLPLYFGGKREEARAQMVEDVLAKLGMSGVAKWSASDLSVGEKQMVSFARAIAANPQILLLDEPTEALDPLLRDILVSAIRSENAVRGRTILIASHDRNVLGLAGQVVNLRPPDRRRRR